MKKKLTIKKKTGFLKNSEFGFFLLKIAGNAVNSVITVENFPSTPLIKLTSLSNGNLKKTEITVNEVLTL